MWRCVRSLNTFAGVRKGDTGQVRDTKKGAINRLSSVFRVSFDGTRAETKIARDGGEKVIQFDIERIGLR